MFENRGNFSRAVLLRLVLVLALAGVLLVLNGEFLLNVYIRNQPTAAGWVINGGILLLFLLGLARLVAVLLRYMREEQALHRFVQALENNQAASDIDRRSLIARRYEALLTLSRGNAPINHAALAAAQVARESTAISLPKFVNNTLILTGVFGTIVSLSIALLGASNLLGSAQGEAGNMGLVIHGMSTALSTTITAIVCYMIYGYFYLKLTDAQTHLFGQIEQVTTLYLLPRFAYTPDTLMQRVGGLVKGLVEVAEVMRTVQTDYLAATSQLHSLLAVLNQRTRPMAEDLQAIQALLREGFRLPAPEGD